MNNGDPTNHQPEKGTQHRVFHGLAQLIVQTKAGERGPIILRATGSNLLSGEVVLDSLATPSRPAVPELSNPPLAIVGWKRSPVTESTQDPNQQTLETDMNSWSDAHPGAWLPPFRRGRYAIYRAHFTPRVAT